MAGTRERISDEPIPDILLEGPLHKIMVFFHQVTHWPDAMMAMAAVLLATVAGLVWHYVLADVALGLLVGLLQLLFMAADSAILISLPRRRLSYGPWKPQLVVLALPRLLATAVLSGAGLWLGWGWGIALMLAVQLLATVALIWGTIIEPFRLRLTEVEIITDRLPAQTSPVRILHISDLHVERLTRREEEVVRLVEEAQPDLVVITGDYVNLSYNRDPETQAQVRQLLGRLSAPYGVYATLGSPPVDLRETVVPIFDGLPIPLLRQDWQTVELGQGRRLVLLGMDCTHHIPTDEVRLQRLMAAAPNGVPQILLYHSPELMPQATQHGIDLYVCGHTHGGQVRLPFIGPILTSSQLGRRYVMGLYRNGRTHLYVSRGIGLEGLSAPRVRFLAPPEMTLITLRPA
jgi:predicted MPP superfamily phosphohydrolase